MDLVVLVPSRARPYAAKECFDAFEATRIEDDTRILFVVDSDDVVAEYESLGLPMIVLPKPGNMVNALNHAAEHVIEDVEPEYLGFVGDDHRFRTKGWDKLFREVLEARVGGMVYANDLFRVGGDIPTQIFMSASIVVALGWMGLPTCRHLFIDNVWRVIGEAIQALYYMPDVVIEHLHPAAGKALWDEGHRRVNTDEMYSHDRIAFGNWLASSEVDIERARDALGRRA